MGSQLVDGWGMAGKRGNRDQVKTALLRACKMAYRKHCLDDGKVGWGELSDELYSVLAEAMGDHNFVKWLDRVSPDRPITEHK